MKCCNLVGASSPFTIAAVNPWSLTLLSLAILVPVSLALFFLREKWLWRFGVFLGVTMAIGALETWWLAVPHPATATALAVQQLNGGNAVANEMRAFEATRNSLHLTACLVVLLTALVCFGRYFKMAFDKFKGRGSKTAKAAIVFLALTILTGCLKPYDRPEYVEIDTSDTGFLIPLEGDVAQQAKFQSEDYLKQRKVAAKRVQITHRWSQEGRFEYDGRWIPIVRLVKVNRSPVTREWSTESAPAPGSQTRRADKAVWIESADSVGFSMGFTCTAFIAEDDAAKFLYWYPSGSLADVMDHEVRGRIQQVGAEVAAKYPLDLLRAKKQEIADAVKEDVTNFFTTRGVSVTTVGMFGGMKYENPEIQKSIDATFIAQQLKVVSEARFEAQKKENERIELEANATAEKVRREALGLADAKKLAADGEAEAIRKVNQALNESQQNPVLYQLKVLEVEKARIEKWDGKYPTYFMGTTGGGSPNLLMQMPSMSSIENKK